LGQHGLGVQQRRGQLPIGEPPRLHHLLFVHPFRLPERMFDFITRSGAYRDRKPLRTNKAPRPRGDQRFRPGWVFPLPTTTESVSWSGNIHPALLETQSPQPFSRTSARTSARTHWCRDLLS
jgi:hypothetical protein